MPALPPDPRADAPGLALARFHHFVRRRRLGWWAAVAVCAAATAAGIGRLTAEAEATLDRYGAARTVLVAVDDVAAGVPLSSGDVRPEDRPVGLVPDDALTELPAGAVTRDALARGEVVLARRVDPTGASALAAGLPPGTRGVAVPRTEAVPPVVPGDRVDVLTTPSGYEPGFRRATVVARRAEVVDVGETVVVVAVGEAEVPAVAAAAGTGLVGLVLVPAPR
jgi:Flp pilus assembly protein CpaB